MIGKPGRGLFITGTGTGVGKTHVAAAIARSLVRAGVRVGVYKPAASGCERVAGKLVSTDAVALWEAAGCPGTLEAVCPQCFEAPLAPHLAARAEGREIDAQLLREGLAAWSEYDVVIVEGAGGLMSPMGDGEYVADLAYEFGYRLMVVAANELGTINATLLTLMAAAGYRGGLEVAGVVLNRCRPPATLDISVVNNREELESRTNCPIVAELLWRETSFDRTIDWLSYCRLAG